MFPGDIATVPSNTREVVVGSWDSRFGGCSFETRSCSQVVAFWRRFSAIGPLLSALSLVSGCAPKVSAGEWQCANEGGASDGGTSQPAQLTDPVILPWSAGFELAEQQAAPAPSDPDQPKFENFCDYVKVAGYCYGDRPYVVVTEPHRSGRFSAEFKVIGDEEHQTRCVRQGLLPESAYYGAWYFIQQPVTNARIWNLWHFQGRDSVDEAHHDLWDVSLYRGAQDGDWELGVYDFVAGPTYRSADHKTIPIGSWFHIELFLKRATDGSGKIALYQDGVLLFEKMNLKSDASKITQWYVGDLADTPTPPESSLYVDDVSISAALGALSATP